MTRGILAICGLVALFAFAFTNQAFAEAKETVLYNFQCGTDGCGPSGALVRDQSGNLYGTTGSGGNLACGNGSGCGTVFELTSDNTGNWTETVLYSFAGGTDGAYPKGGVILDAKGNLYGTTTWGVDGKSCQNSNSGCGTVFKLSNSGGGWTESVLYAFSGGADGAFPEAGLVFDKTGNLYGTTLYGGVNSCTYVGCGTVFELASTSSGWIETVIYAFPNVFGGYSPTSGVTFDYLGNLYGAASGGAYSNGVIFRLVPSPGGWTENTIWSFSGGYEGVSPTGVITHDGALYGVAAGGQYNVGNVFQLRPAVGNWMLTVIHSFTGGNDGGLPYVGVVADSDHLYGTTQFGGYFQFGTVFRLTPESNDQWKEDVLYNFKGQSDGANPYSPLLLSPGSLFGFDNIAPGGQVYEITAK